MHRQTNNKMSGNHNARRPRNVRPRDRNWRDSRQSGLLGNAPRHVQGRPQPGLLGGAPRNPPGGALHRPSPWESGMTPGNCGMGMGMTHGHDPMAWGAGNPLQAPSLLGNPEMVRGGGGGGPGLLGGAPHGSVLGINQLTRLNNNDPKMALNVLGPNATPHPYRDPPNMMRPMDRGKMAHSGRYNRSVGSGGGGGGGNRSSSDGSSRDLRKWLKDKRGLNDARPAHQQSSSTAPNSSHFGGQRSSSSSAASRRDRPSGISRKPAPKVVDEKDAEAEEKCPVEALRCHVCKLDSFTSVDDYKKHLKSSVHGEILNALHRKNSAVLDLLRQQSKIAAMHLMLALDDKDAKKSQCYKCICKVAGSLQKHINSVEHKLVNNFQIVKCCNVWFSSRPDYEHHRLGFRHLLAKHEERQKVEVPEPGSTVVGDNEEAPLDNQDEWWGAADRALKCLRRTCDRPEPLTSASLPPYSGDTPVGESFLSCHASLKCSACDERLDPSLAEVHCRSNAHYMHVLSALKSKEDKEAPAATETSRDEEVVDACHSTDSSTDLPSQSPSRGKDGDEGSHFSEETRDGTSMQAEAESKDDDIEEGSNGPEDDEDERMIYEGLNDEPQLDFVEEEELCQKSDDSDTARDCVDLSAKQEDEYFALDKPNGEVSAPSNGADKKEEGHSDDEDADQFKYEDLDDVPNRDADVSSCSAVGTDDAVAVVEEVSIDVTDPQKNPEISSDPIQNVEPPAEDSVSLNNMETLNGSQNNAVVSTDTSISADASETSRDETVAKQEDKEDEANSESANFAMSDVHDSASLENYELPKPVKEDDEAPKDEESVATRRSGRSVKKRVLDEVVEDVGAMEPSPKKGRGRGRGRGARK
ncbi:uncharacterized protein LOC108667529 [Hyalella azteca]|uniref:Uncharacterized protein LOC108667529 n=1 Tax=Hyalella azteca TaxID=294128 RepID=A0A8B7N817_HYAAZ|nr:uncharacterized protein LOC108667529 [Hyalella azteca]